MMMNGFVLRLADGTVVHEPIEVVHLGGACSQPLAYHPRNLIVLAPRSQDTLIEHHTTLGPIGEEGKPYYPHTGTGVSLAEGDVLQTDRLKSEETEALHPTTKHT